MNGYGVRCHFTDFVSFNTIIGVQIVWKYMMRLILNILTFFHTMASVLLGTILCNIQNTISICVRMYTILANSTQHCVDGSGRDDDGMRSVLLVDFVELNHWNVWCIQLQFVPGEYTYGKIVANNECVTFVSGLCGINLYANIYRVFSRCYTNEYREEHTRVEKPTLKFHSLIFRCLFL